MPGAGTKSGTGLFPISDADLDINSLKANFRCLLRRVGKSDFLTGNQAPGDYFLDVKLGSTGSICT
jgi:hypothetical protein